MAMGPTEPVTGLSTRSVFLGGRWIGLTTLPLHVPTVLKFARERQLFIDCSLW